MSFLDYLTTLFAPDDCLLCGREGLLLCAACSTKLPALPGRCFGCSKAVLGVSCMPCLIEARLSSLTAITHYTGVSKALIAQLKFVGNQSAAKIIARSMNVLEVADHSIIANIPATAPHIRQRGYDQAELISKHLLLSPNVRRVTLLARTGDRHQLGSNRKQRNEQLQESIRVIRPDLVRGKHIMLIDDVLTTGSSMRAAATALLNAGAASVSGIVFAQAFSEAK